MGIYIKDMEMPKVCYDCDFCTYGFCSRIERYVTDSYSREEDCPIIGLPPHGDLIDRDELHQSIKDSIDECHKWANEVKSVEMYTRVSQALGTFVECALRVKNTSTVIPAEGKEK